MSSRQYAHPSIGGSSSSSGPGDDLDRRQSRNPLRQQQQQQQQQQPPRSGNTMSGYHLRSRAGGLLASGSNFLATRDWQGMASTVKQKVADAGAYTQQQSHRQSFQQDPSARQRNGPRRSMSTSSTATNPAFRPTQPNEGLTSLNALKPGQENPVLLPGWAQRNVARDRHPQSWSAPDAPEDLEDGEIELQISIDGFVAKTLDAPTRSQRLFNQMARQLAALPRLPSTALDSQMWDSSTTLTEEPQDLAAGTSSTPQQQQQQQPSPSREDEPASFRDKAISKLMEGADEETLVRLMENLGAFPTEVSSAEAASKLEGRTLHGPHSQRKDTADAAAAKPSSTASAAASSSSQLDVPGGFSRPSRQNTASSTSSSASTLGGSLFWADRTAEELHRLHRNLGERLRAYWIYRSTHKDVNIEISPVVRGEALRSSGGERVLLAATRLTTDSTGQFSHRLVVPWHMISGFCSFHSSVAPRDIDGVEIRAVLPSPSPSRILEPGTGAPTGNDDDDTRATPWLRYPLTEDGHRKVRVISDIDDTVKQTGVLLGTKRILRNVFVLPFEEVEVPGVAAWYQSMVSMGVGLHYVTNAPLELHRLVSDFFAAVKLPFGHLTLKHYPSGTRSLLASWLEPAGERKRANVVKILDEFRQSQFILIGDSGELDLELYTALAAERPGQVRAIFIRDVSSPRPGDARSPTSTAVPPLSSSSAFGAGLPATGSDADAVGGAGSGGAGETLSKPPAAALPPLQDGVEPALAGSAGGGVGEGANGDLSFFQPSYPPLDPSAAAAAASSASSSSLPLSYPALASKPGGLSDADLKRKQAFQSRLLRATSKLPRTTVFRLFYEGGDVESEALRLVRELQSGTRPADR
ncbi:uncharacterized protein PFL1_01462 [Pseudozyma flocculosa PF-1]|uniref:Related to APP1 - Actin Patch Protein n=1 Tax=Pseudozyma flocculosa TaxID=84751 RepID=A0A5C3FBL9_9BASI|nr:uncharacterized protein PFL1_01462 [Pseudozyma flocculosa PF-1]EPQ31277.1 hypothetical protein PFL1_01462 [Pseudozyma flocculosa PF-1]SPO41738.1 related to APP1 - Actin Patch Protein [Pseudozyma flocculosa]